MQVFPAYKDIEKDFQQIRNKLPAKQALDLEKAVQACYLPFPPKRVNLGLTSKCNYNCPFCFNHASSRFDYVSGHFMDRPVLEALLQQLDGVLELAFEVMGETLLYPNILEIMELAATKAKKLAMTTNGGLLSPELNTRLSALPFAEIFISCEASDEQTYEQLRQNGHFRNFCKNVSDLCAKARFPVKFNAIVFAKNMESLLNLPKLASSLGIQAIQFVPPNETPQARAQGLVRPDTNILIEFIENIQKECKEQGIACQFIWSLLSPETAGLIPGQDLHQYCPQPFDALTIDPWGRANFCCYLEWLEQDTIFTASPSEIWNSLPVRILRAMNITGIFPAVCQQYCHRRPAFQQAWKENLYKKYFCWPGYWQETDWANFHAQAGPFVLWPAGKVTRALLREDIFPPVHRPLGIVDRQAHSLQREFTLPVWTDAELCKQGVQSVLITSDTFTDEILLNILSLKQDLQVFFFTGKDRLLFWGGPASTPEK